MGYDFKQHFNMNNAMDRDDYRRELTRLHNEAETKGEGVIVNGVFTIQGNPLIQVKKGICSYTDYIDQVKDNSATTLYNFRQSGDEGESIFRLDLQRSEGSIIGTYVKSDYLLAVLLNDALNHNEQEEAWAAGTYNVPLNAAAERLNIDLQDVAQPGKVKRTTNLPKKIATYDGQEIVVADGDRRFWNIGSLNVIVYTQEALLKDSDVHNQEPEEGEDTLNPIYHSVRNQITTADYVIVSTQAWESVEDAEASRNAISPWRMVSNMAQDYDKPVEDRRGYDKADLEASLQHEKDYILVQYPQPDCIVWLKGSYDLRY